MDMLHKEDGPVFFRNVSLWYVLFGSFGMFTLTILSPFLVTFFTSESYHESWKLVGVLGWASVFYGFYLLSGLGMFYSKKTYLTLYVYGSGAVLNIVLNILLIPVLGLMGAAYGTVLSMLFSNVVGMIVSNNYYKIEWHWMYMALSIFVASGLSIYWIQNQ